MKDWKIIVSEKSAENIQNLSVSRFSSSITKLFEYSRMFLQLSYTERTIENANDLRSSLVKN